MPYAYNNPACILAFSDLSTALDVTTNLECPPAFSDLPTALDVTTKLEESHNATCIPRDPTNAKAIYHCSNTINFKPQNEMWESDLFLFYLPTAVFIDSMALLSYVLSEPVCMYFEMKC